MDSGILLITLMIVGVFSLLADGGDWWIKR
jgi:hypothetical protein